jgi:hypothetical protein
LFKKSFFFQQSGRSHCISFSLALVVYVPLPLPLNAVVQAD